MGQLRGQTQMWMVSSMTSTTNTLRLGAKTVIIPQGGHCVHTFICVSVYVCVLRIVHWTSTYRRTARSTFSSEWGMTLRRSFRCCRIRRDVRMAPGPVGSVPSPAVVWAGSDDSGRPACSHLNVLQGPEACPAGSPGAPISGGSSVCGWDDLRGSTSAADGLAGSVRAPHGHCHRPATLEAAITLAENQEDHPRSRRERVRDGPSWPPATTIVCTVHALPCLHPPTFTRYNPSSPTQQHPAPSRTQYRPLGAHLCFYSIFRFECQLVDPLANPKARSRALP